MLRSKLRRLYRQRLKWRKLQAGYASLESQDVAVSCSSPAPSNITNRGLYGQAVSDANSARKAESFKPVPEALCQEDHSQFQLPAVPATPPQMLASVNQQDGVLIDSSGAAPVDETDEHEGVQKTDYKQAL